ncbi:hypothetical protein CHS0354_025241 [Potamilus streckersoni]|uniref:Uncharacterized protein n=1 Tax=Potamilus streckersoni TaxID=2493646 RepID=A0AAE0RRY5_9BIVA|nr:hypothetical protein CHS0354_025241 [Potamilus streckersoni]
MRRIVATRCFKNKEFGDRGGNTYYCEDPSKSNCCEENSMFTCCEDKGTRTLTEQLTLWGCVAAAIIVIAAIMIYFFKDINCCSDDRPLSERCCQRCRRTQDENDLTSFTEKGGVMPHENSPWSSSLYRSSNYVQLPPLKY